MHRVREFVEITRRTRERRRRWRRAVGVGTGILGIDGVVVRGSGGGDDSEVWVWALA